MKCWSQPSCRFGGLVLLLVCGRLTDCKKANLEGIATSWPAKRRISVTIL